MESQQTTQEAEKVQSKLTIASKKKVIINKSFERTQDEVQKKEYPNKKRRQNKSYERKL